MRAFHGLCALFALVGCAGATTPNLDVTEYFRTSLSLGQGAPTAVYALAQTADGFLWVGSPSGLFRFDGVRFERIDSVGTTRLLSQGITTVTPTRSGGLWIGYEYGGASLLEGGTLRNYPLESGLPSGSLKSLAIDSDGVVWAGTSQGLARLDGQRWTDMTDRVGMPSHYIEQVMPDATGGLWIHTAENIALLRRGSAHVHVYTMPADNVFHADSTGRVWTMQRHPACLYLLDATRDADPPCRPLPAGTFAFWLIPRGGEIWISDTSEHMRVIPTPDASATAAPSIADRPFITYRGGEPVSALQDREGNIWFGTWAGLEQMRVARLRSHGPFAKLVVLGAGNHNSLWVGTQHSDSGLSGDDFFRLNDGLMEPYADGPGGITASYREPTGALWVGGYGGLWRLEDRKWERMSTPPELATRATTTRIPIQAITRETRGTVWLSVARAGLFRLQNAQWEQVLIPGIPASEYPVVIHADAKSSVWFGYPHGRIVSLNRGAWRLYTEKNGITVGSVQALADVNGEIWIGGDRGLGRIHDGRFESLRSLDALGSISGLLQEKNGDLWLSCSIGAVHIDAQELSRFSADPRKTPHYDTFDHLDGMPGAAPAIRPLPTVLQSDDGRIWFEANDSFASIDPREHLHNDIAPTVIISSVTDDGRRRDARGSLALIPKVRNVAIEYTATSLSIPSRIRFRYRLDNFDSSWQDVGTRRTAYYNSLPAGHYVFHVIAANDDGVWNTRGAAVSLFVPPLFYQTLLFRILAAVLAVLLLGALFFGRLRQVTDRQRKRLEQRLEDRLEERTRIARELHDSLLQGFQGLMFRLQAVRQLLPERPGDAARCLDTALQAGDQAIGEGRDAVENLRSPTFDDHDLATALAALGAELGLGMEPQAQPRYRVVVEGRPRELRAGVRDDAYRIVREAVRNAHQHARARHIEVDVTFREADLSIRVRDDGIGVDPQILECGQRPGHWGLPGMRERSDSFGGRLYIWSEKNAGTEVELRLAARIAYARQPARAR